MCRDERGGETGKVRVESVIRESLKGGAKDLNGKRWNGGSEMPAASCVEGKKRERMVT